MSETPAAKSPTSSSAWKNLVDDQVAHLELGLREAARLEGQGVERAMIAWMEVARLSQDTFAFWLQLSSSFRDLSLDTARRAARLLTPRG